jgi:uncharacterized protein (TIGR02145 family)
MLKYILASILFVTVLSSNGQSPEEKTVKDIDGNIYETITIGPQTWMKQNLKSSRYNDGTHIALVTKNSEWAGLESPAYCWYNNDESKYKNPYGAIYNGYVTNSGNVCTFGWHVPTDKDWQILEMSVGMSKSDSESPGWRGKEGGKLAGADTLWVKGTLKSDSVFGNSGFEALPAGNRIAASGSFGNMGSNAYWWTDTEAGNNTAWARNLFYGSSHIIKSEYNKSYGFSIRCVKNN